MYHECVRTVFFMCCSLHTARSMHKGKVVSAVMATHLAFRPCAPSPRLVLLSLSCCPSFVYPALLSLLTRCTCMPWLSLRVLALSLARSLFPPLPRSLPALLLTLCPRLCPFLSHLSQQPRLRWEQGLGCRPGEGGREGGLGSHAFCGRSQVCTLFTSSQSRLRTRSGFLQH